MTARVVHETLMPAKALNGFKASDLMQTDVITLPADAPIQEAIETFEEYHISGLPVVNEVGEVVGVLSAHDVARMSQETRERDESGSARFYVANPLDEDTSELWEDEEFFSKEDYSTEVTGPVAVKDWMTHKVISVAPAASLKQVCAKMDKESVHRVLVMEGQTLKGLISSFDIVRFLAKKL